MKKIRKIVPVPGFLKQKRILKKPGQAPGTLQFTGNQFLDEIIMTLYDYDAHQLGEYDITTLDSLKPYLDSPSNTWLKISGLHDVEKLKDIWDYFELHPLVQEDILNTHQRPKIEEYTDHLYLVMRLMHIDESNGEMKSQQLSIVLGANYLLSFQEDNHPVFEPVLHRLRSEAPRLRKSTSDYLAYALVDTVVDHYFRVLEQLGDELEDLEFKLIDHFDDSIPGQIHAIRRKLLYFRKAIWPMRDSLNNLLRDESSFINEENKIYFRDVYDHLVQIIDGLENYRDLVIGLLDMYMSQVSNKMNEVMKVLTIIATIFIPLTFIAGVYGMNFEYMPELSWQWGYPAVWGLMILAGAGMYYFFKKRTWL